tara:strand:- start:5421 stop:6002 length:582 start_codon:yes stop_codon:yes gene_type:complete
MEKKELNVKSVRRQLKMDKIDRLEKSVNELQNLCKQMVETITIQTEFITSINKDVTKWVSPRDPGDENVKKKAKPIDKYKAKPKDLDMVIRYFREKNINDAKKNAVKFYNHYEAGGWMRGKTKIKNWKMCISSWEFNDFSTPNKQLWKMNDMGFYRGYCEKCGDVGLGKNLYELKTVASCCGVNYLPSKPNRN